jgi:hypothetical protein
MYNITFARNLIDVLTSGSSLSEDIVVCHAGLLLGSHVSVNGRQSVSLYARYKPDVNGVPAADTG